MEHEKLAKKVMEFCDQSWYFNNFAPKLCQICVFSVTTKTLSSYLERLHFLMFSTKCRKCGRKMVMENQEIVMEKSWKNILSNLWEP